MEKPEMIKKPRTAACPFMRAPRRRIAGSPEGLGKKISMWLAMTTLARSRRTQPSVAQRLAVGLANVSLLEEFMLKSRYSDEPRFESLSRRLRVEGWGLTAYIHEPG